MARIKIVGYEDARTIESIFASSMVDVAYIDQITPDAIYVVGDIGLNFEKPDDYQWTRQIIEITMAQHGVTNLEITVSLD